MLYIYVYVYVYVYMYTFIRFASLSVGGRGREGGGIESKGARNSEKSARYQIYCMK